VQQEIVAKLTDLKAAIERGELNLAVSRPSGSVGICTSRSSLSISVVEISPVTLNLGEQAPRGVSG
jgi:hypothetical protein